MSFEREFYFFYKGKKVAIDWITTEFIIGRMWNSTILFNDSDRNVEHAKVRAQSSK